nr:BTB/POZ and MATH domain-containing protein 2-like [Aegilops tauschii subsp. strangulata]
MENLEISTGNQNLGVNYTFSLIDSGGGGAQPWSPFIRRFAHNYTSVDVSYGADMFIKQSALESVPYLRDDTVVIECEVKVIRWPQVQEETVLAATHIEAPPSDLSNHLRKLLDGKRGADVTFEVKGEVFPAHKIMLATRSPVFDAQLYGSMSAANATSNKNIIVQDMEPPVFRALLNFIYTDSLPAMDDLDDGENQEMVKHLLVAADRYAMDRMKMICEVILCKSLDVETVATTLALADQHQCSKLKDACVEFILSSNRINDVVASQGYAHLKRSCPALMFDVFERATKSRKI